MGDLGIAPPEQAETETADFNSVVHATAPVPANTDSIDPDINADIAELSVSDSTEPAEVSPVTLAESNTPVTSPVKKKSKTSKTSKTKSTSKAPPSILKGSKSNAPNAPAHNHAFKNVICEASFQPTATVEKDSQALGILLKNGAIVDPHFIFTPRHPSIKATNWALVPSNMRELRKFVFISTPAWQFKNKGTKKSENMVYFSSNPIV